jgi:protein-disulfide isomerase
MQLKKRIIYIFILVLFSFQVISCKQSVVKENKPDEKFAEVGMHSYVDVNVEKIPVYKTGNDLVLGDKNAKITIIEYSSFSCHHCSKFHERVFPGIKKKYIETGKVKFIHRDLPSNVQSLYGAVALKCLSDEKNYYDALDILFANNSEWVYSEGNTFISDLYRQLGSFGFKNQQELEKCLKDKNIGQVVLDGRNYAIKELEVDSTPTFFIDGTKIVGYTSLKDMEKTINNKLKN